MTKTQISFFKELGGRIEKAPDGSEYLADFGDYSRECDAFEQSVCLCDATDSGLLRISGDDAESFLNGQLSTNVKKLQPGQGGYTTYNSPKGRIVASFFLWRASDAFYALLSADLVEAVQKRLSMYVLRAKVTIENVSEQYAYLGLCGRTSDAAASMLAKQALKPGNIFERDGLMVAALSAQRYLVLTAPEQLADLWRTLSEKAQPAGRNLWQRAAILAAIPMITAPTSEKLIPQSTNWDALDGVDFNKGCYTGQEIIARTRYLGRIKERLYLARCEHEGIFAAATPVYSPIFGEQACGMVVNAAPDRSGQVMLISMQTKAENDAVHVQSSGGEVLVFDALPYELPIEETSTRAKP